jgi:hypothetical protein
MGIKIASTFMIMLSLNSLASSEINSFVDKAKSLLPEAVLERVHSTPVKFETLNTVELNSPCDKKDFIFGKHSEGKISISSKLIDHLSPTEKVEFECKHKNYYKTALSTLLHEYFHAYENTLPKSEKIHLDPEFKSLGFWKINKKKDKNQNTYSKRSPNKYEYSSTKEFTAVNFEYFLLDPEFKCRRPNLYSAYSSRLSHTPFQDIKCSSLREVSFSDTHKIGSIDLNFDEVREIHYLFASKGTAMMSRWGHSMFKLVSCPTDWSLNKCRTRGKFTVIGFLAQVSDVNINAVKGIMGDYPSDLVITDLDSMKRQYNRAELRDLMSLPMKFSKNEKERFLNHLLRVYWEYSGRYYFFTNNCADEAFKFLQIAYNKTDYYKKKVVTPLGILNFVKKNDLIDDYQFTKTKENISEGLLYESFQTKLERSYSFLKEKYKDVFKIKNKTPSIKRAKRKFSPKYRSIKNITEYSQLPTYTRRLMIEEVLKSADKKTVLNLFAIESQAHYVTGNKLLNVMQKKSSELKEVEGTGDIFKEIVEFKNIILFGTNSNNQGYGIPQAGDLEQVISEEAIYAQEELGYLKSELQTIYREIFKNEFERIDESNENKILIKKALRKVL